MAPFFSIIIPCCDVAQYVHECVEALKGQAFTDFEVLLVVEESSDETERVVREEIGGDARFRVFTEGRSGSPATPRNTGLEQAWGEYVLFVDGDDLLETEALAYLASEIAKQPGADIYPFAYQKYNEMTGERIGPFGHLLETPAKLSGKEAFLYSDILSWHIVCGWGKVYRRQFLEDEKLRFVPGLVHEDEEFTPRAFYRASRIVPLHKSCYIYRCRANSLTTRAFDGRKFLENYATVYHSLLAFHTKVSEECDYDPLVAAYWAKAWIGKIMIYWFSERFVKNIPRKTRQETLRKLFRDGFADFDGLLRRTTRSRRVAAWWVKLFLRHPNFAWFAEAFFLKVYFPLTATRNSRKQKS